MRFRQRQWQSKTRNVSDWIVCCYLTKYLLEAWHNNFCSKTSINLNENEISTIERAGWCGIDLHLNIQRTFELLDREKNLHFAAWEAEFLIFFSVFGLMHQSRIFTSKSQIHSQLFRRFPHDSWHWTVESVTSYNEIKSCSVCFAAQHMNVKERVNNTIED